jgi:hypothetical protein
MFGKRSETDGHCGRESRILGPVHRRRPGRRFRGRWIMEQGQAHGFTGLGGEAERALTQEASRLDVWEEVADGPHLDFSQSRGKAKPGRSYPG